MHYWIAFIVENSTRWYISRVNPDTNKRFADRSAYIVNFGPEQAFQFETKEDAFTAIALFCEDKPNLKLAGVAEINLYPLSTVNGTNKSEGTK